MEKSEIDRVYLKQLLELGVPKTRIAEIFGMSRMTLYRYLRNNPFTERADETIKTQHGETLLINPEQQKPSEKSEEKEQTEIVDLSDLMNDLSDENF